MLTRLIPLILLVAACATTTPSTALWTLSDPRGDDYGNGALAYPMNPDYERGDLDLLGLTNVARKCQDIRRSLGPYFLGRLV